ncbi:MAG: protein kinase, partial [Acidobacteriota bacterium]
NAVRVPFGISVHLRWNPQVMELITGITLPTPQPLETALHYAKQIAEALEAAHEKGITHRDLKPANIMVTPEGLIKVLDFGLASIPSREASSGIAGDPATSPTMTMAATQAGMIMGTAAYMSPEQAAGKPVDKRSDIWSYGVVLHELLAGKKLFDGETISHTLANVLRAPVDLANLPTTTPAPIVQLLKRCLTRDPKKRLQAIGEARILVEDPTLLEPTPPTTSTAPPPPRRALLAWALAASALALAALTLAISHFRESPTLPIPVRFQIPAPENTNFNRCCFALSPDGRELAFITFAGGRPMLWLRPLDSLEAHALPGTEGANFLPFWSPDSRSIAFGAQRKLKKMDAAGGPPQTLAEIPGSITGGSWNRDGVILFSSVTGGLYRVPQSGGTPINVTTPDEAHGELAHLLPWFLPDGKHFLYLTRMANAQEQAIYLASLDGKDRKRLAALHKAAAYAPPAPGSKNGHLLFLREDALMAQPMDPASYQLSADPFPIADHVGSLLGIGLFSVSANGTLVYRQGANTGISITRRLTWFDRAGKQQGFLGPPAPYWGSVALSPDGKRVVMEQMDSAGKIDIWFMDIARGVPTRFTFGAAGIANNRNPVWSPDSSRLIFDSDRVAPGLPDLYQKLSSGAGNEKLIPLPGQLMTATSWSSDGQRLMYTHPEPKTSMDLWVLPLSPEGAKPVPYLQTPSNELQGQFSPDGRWVAYISDESAPGQYQVYVQSFPAGAGKFQISTGPGGTQPRWRHDGKELFYVTPGGMLMAVELNFSPRFEPGAPRALFDTQSLRSPDTNNQFLYDVTPDGKRFLIRTSDGAAETDPPITVLTNWQSAAAK